MRDSGGVRGFAGMRASLRARVAGAMSFAIAEPLRGYAVAPRGILIVAHARSASRLHRARRARTRCACPSLGAPKPCSLRSRVVPSLWRYGGPLRVAVDTAGTSCPRSPKTSSAGSSSGTSLGSSNTSSSAQVVEARRVGPVTADANSAPVTNRAQNSFSFMGTSVEDARGRVSIPKPWKGTRNDTLTATALSRSIEHRACSDKSAASGANQVHRLSPATRCWQGQKPAARLIELTIVWTSGART